MRDGVGNGRWQVIRAHLLLRRGPMDLKAHTSPQPDQVAGREKSENRIEGDRVINCVVCVCVCVQKYDQFHTVGSEEHF